ncbi:aspartate aminotransferase [Lachnospiraceae bacterium KM106-2]|nr:aspartate aminotransferase [Lachnospiraceae bacterium KM106-2]
MRELLSKKAVGLKPSGIRKFFDVANEMEDVISLGVGEPDFDTPWHIREEGINSFHKGRTFYTSNAGLMDLRKEICKYIKKKQNLTYDPEKEVLLTVGGSEGIDAALRALLNPGDEVIYIEPCFVSYLPCIVLADGVPKPIALSEENGYRLTREQLEKAITPKTKVLMLSYPNNPTGAIMERKDYEALIDLIIEHDLIVISDEIYSELTYEKETVSIASLPGMQERTIIINGFSKAYAMTGWRLGYALANPVIMEQMVKIHQFAIMCAPTTSQYAAIEAMRNGDDDVTMMCQSYNQRRRYLLSEFKRLGLPCFEPHGAFYTFPNISEFGMTSEEFATRLLKEERLAVVPGSAFGECGEGHVRISYAYSVQEIKQAMKRMERFIHKLRDDQ